MLQNVEFAYERDFSQKYRVRAFDEVFATEGFGQGNAVEQLLGVLAKPQVSTMAGDFVGNSANNASIEQGNASFIVESWQRNTPVSLTGDAPIGPRGNGTADTVLTPIGYPLDVSDGVEDFAAYAIFVERDEPLIN